MRDTEKFLREKVILKEGTWKAIHFHNYQNNGIEIKECSICRYDCFLSAIVCPCSPDKIVCLRHSNDISYILNCFFFDDFLFFNHFLVM